MAFGELVTGQVDGATNWSGNPVCNLPGVATDGNLLVFCHFDRKESQSAPTNFTQAVKVNFGGENSDDLAIYYKVAEGGEQQVTAAGTAEDYNTAVLAEFEGPFTEPDPLDAVGDDGDATDSASAASGEATATVSSSLAIACIGARQPGASPYIDAGWSDSFVQIIEQTDDAYNTLAIAAKILTGTGAVSTTATLDGTLINTGCIAIFKASGGEPAPASRRIMTIGKDIINLPFMAFCLPFLGAFKNNTLSRRGLFNVKKWFE